MWRPLPPDLCGKIRKHETRRRTTPGGSPHCSQFERTHRHKTGRKCENSRIPLPPHDHWHNRRPWCLSHHIVAHSDGRTKPPLCQLVSARYMDSYDHFPALAKAADCCPPNKDASLALGRTRTHARDELARSRPYCGTSSVFMGQYGLNTITGVPKVMAPGDRVYCLHRTASRARRTIVSTEV